MKKILVLGFILLSLTSCATQEQLIPKENMKSAYNNNAETTINIKTNIPQQSVNQVPIIQPPIIQPMWIPPHTTRDQRVFVTGHWIFVQINNPHWYIDTNKNPINLGISVEQE